MSAPSRSVSSSSNPFGPVAPLDRSIGRADEFAANRVSLIEQHQQHLASQGLTEARLHMTIQGLQQQIKELVAQIQELRSTLTLSEQTRQTMYQQLTAAQALGARQATQITNLQQQLQQAQQGNALLVARVQRLTDHVETLMGANVLADLKNGK